MYLVPVNLKDRDAFHLTIEEYLHSLISLVDELASSSAPHIVLVLIAESRQGLLEILSP